MLGRIEERFGNVGEAEKLKANAKQVRSESEGREGDDKDSDAGFASMVTWLSI